MWGAGQNGDTRSSKKIVVDGTSCTLTHMGLKGTLMKEKKKVFFILLNKNRMPFFKFLRSEMGFIVLMTSDARNSSQVKHSCANRHRAAHGDARRGLHKAVTSLLLLQDV